MRTLKVWLWANFGKFAASSAWRDSAVAQIWLCLLLGIVVSLVTIFLHNVVLLSYEFFFALPAHTDLSAHRPDFKYMLIVPVAGGLLLTGTNFLLKRWRQTETVDPIEANAVRGGRMSIKDSLRLVFATVLSNASGASIGMEAAYTQIGSGITSRIGQKFNLRREDLRIFVAAGSAAAIAAAFNAPLAGAFYGFELVLGIYTIRALPHVAVAALSSALVLRMFTAEEPLFYLPMEKLAIPYWHYFLFVGMGILAAQVGILTMKSVTFCERLCKKLTIPEMIQPALGGLIIGLIGFFCPQVLGSGQGAINDHLHNSWPFLLLILLLAAKIIATAISIGFGFRGGLFSASLFIGCLFGQLFGEIARMFQPGNQSEILCFIMVGMGAVTASVVGAPLTIVLLILEMTESFSVTTPVLAAVLVSSIITRYTFGYSFSTWRFHVRGLRISGAFDIGWINEMTVRQLMQTTFRTASTGLSISDMRLVVPASQGKRVFLVDEQGQYQGVVDVAAIHNPDLEKEALDREISELASRQDYFLLPTQNVRESLDLFSKWELEELPVLAGMYDRTIIGTLAESYVLRRYAQELETRNLAVSGAGTPKSGPK